MAVEGSQVEADAVPLTREATVVKQQMEDVARDLLDDDVVKTDVVDVLAEFFQDSFKDDPVGVGDWLAQNGTSVDLFVQLVAQLRTPQESGRD
jgi:hypothetical protein